MCVPNSDEDNFESNLVHAGEVVALSNGEEDELWRVPQRQTSIKVKGAGKCGMYATLRMMERETMMSAWPM